MLRATTACTFSTSQRPQVLRTWSALSILTWKCASRQNAIHFFIISTSTRGPTIMCFNHFGLEMPFAPQRRAISHKTVEKHGVSWLFYLVAHLRIFFLLTLSLLWSFFYWLFLFSDSSHLCFSICPHCRKFDFQTFFDYIFLRTHGTVIRGSSKKWLVSEVRHGERAASATLLGWPSSERKFGLKVETFGKEDGK